MYITAGKDEVVQTDVHAPQWHRSLATPLGTSHSAITDIVNMDQDKEYKHNQICTHPSTKHSTYP